MMEAILRPSSWSDFPREFKMGFRLFRTTGVGWLMISVMNVFVNQLLPQAIVRKLSDEEMRRYREPFPSVGSRKPVRQWPREIPIDGDPADVTEAVESYASWLQGTDLPKLLFHASPGAIIRAPDVAWTKEHLRNMKTVDLGEGIHYLQEDHPHRIGAELAEWYKSLA